MIASLLTDETLTLENVPHLADVEQLIRILWGAQPLSQSMPQSLKGAVIVGDFLFSRYRLVLLGVVAAILVGVWLLLHKTSFGRVVRAGIQKPDMVAALGIHPHQAARPEAGSANAAITASPIVLTTAPSCSRMARPRKA